MERVSEPSERNAACSAEVGGEESTYDSSTNQPTNQPPMEDLIRYYGYRVTVPHADHNKIKDLFFKYSRNFLMAKHNSDVNSEDKGEHAEHYHVCFLDFKGPADVEKMKKAMAKLTGRSGNGLHMGKWYDNTVFKAIQYYKHDESVEFDWRGSEWLRIIDNSPDWEEPSRKRQKVEVKEKLSFPTATPYNIVKQALRWRREHNLNTTDLRVVCEHMTRVGNWQPCPKTMKNGLDPLHFQLFEYHAKEKVGKCPNWWDPKFC